MINWKTIPQYRATRGSAVADLGKALREGSLVLFLGSGASYAIGLPSWGVLLHKSLQEVGEDPDNYDLVSSGGLAIAADEVRRKIGDKLQYYQLIRKVLYEGVSDLKVSPLLYAIGALLSGTRRGKVSTVLTLNFDDVLEQYLMVHGFSSSVHSSYPCVLGAPDVNIFHPHGYLPRDERENISNANIVLDSLSFDKMMSPQDPTAWRQFIADTIKTKVILSVGLGWKDPNLNTSFAGITNKTLGRPSAFWLSSAKNPAERPSIEAHFEERNVVSLWCEDPEVDYPEFLLQICRAANEIF
jgi:hypothetical protein